MRTLIIYEATRWVCTRAARSTCARARNFFKDLQILFKARAARKPGMKWIVGPAPCTGRDAEMLLCARQLSGWKNVKGNPCLCCILLDCSQWYLNWISSEFVGCISCCLLHGLLARCLWMQWNGFATKYIFYGKFEARKEEYNGRRYQRELLVRCYKLIWCSRFECLLCERAIHMDGTSCLKSGNTQTHYNLYKVSYLFPA